MVAVIGKRLYLDEQATGTEQAHPNDYQPIPRSRWGRDEKFDLLWQFEDAISDDLNTAKCVPLVEQVLGDPFLNQHDRWHIVATMDQVLGLGLLELARSNFRVRPKGAIIAEADIEATLEARKEARAAKDFARSDALRAELAAKGVEVMDGDPLGWEWKLG